MNGNFKSLGPLNLEGEGEAREIIQQGETFYGSTGEEAVWEKLLVQPGSSPGKIRAVIRSFDQAILPSFKKSGETLKEGPDFRKEEWPLMHSWPQHVRVSL